MQGYWYLATPYSKYPGGHEAAFDMACQQTAILAKAGVRVFCPIAHSHPLVARGCEDFGHQDWLDLDQPLLDHARGVIVVTAEGWEESRGMIYEMAECVRAGKPLHMMEVDEVPEALAEEAKFRRMLDLKTHGDRDALQYFDGYVHAWADPARAYQEAVTSWLASS